VFGRTRISGDLAAPLDARDESHRLIGRNATPHGRLAAEPGFAEGPTTVGARAVGLGLTSAGRVLWEAVDWAC
jgi:hypothetical protein